MTRIALLNSQCRRGRICSNKTHFIPLTRQVSCQYLQPQPAHSPARLCCCHLSTSILVIGFINAMSISKPYPHPSISRIFRIDNQANQLFATVSSDKINIMATKHQQCQNMWLFHHHDNAQNETTIHYDGQLFRVDRTFILSGVR